jgi:hypothetical protein
VNNCEHSWPSRSPDLNSRDYFVWEFKNEIFANRSQNTLQLREKMAELWNSINEVLCRTAVTNLVHRLQTSEDFNGGHSEHVLMTKYFLRNYVRK